MTTYTDEELTLERLMADLGANRYRQAVTKAKARGQETSHAPGRMLLARACTRMTEAIEEWKERERSRRGPPSQAGDRLLEEPPELLATLTCKVVLDSISIHRTFGSTARAIAQAVEDEARITYFRGELPRVWDKLKRGFRSADGNAAKRRRILKTMRELDCKWERWGTNERTRVGVTLLDLFVHNTGLVYTQEVSQGKKKQLYVCATRETLEWLEKSHEVHEALFPFYLPMRQPPEQWDGLFGGGYATNLVRGVPLIKLRNRDAQLEAEDADLGEVTEAVNTLQQTAWEINSDVYQVAAHFWEVGTPVADLPRREDLPLPVKPPTIDTDEEARTAWKRAAAIIYDENVSVQSRRVQAAKILFMAAQFEEGEFYFPYSCDFRGRIYPVPYFLQPQGPSLARGLLRFARGKPLGGDENVKLWMVHGANCYGFDKASLTERAAWVVRHESQILASAEDPIDCRWWAEASKPWEFLAFCLEYAQWKDDPRFESKIAVAMDGSNNGLQIFSLLLRDEVGGKATNCVPGRFPQDIYQEVADRVTEQLLAERDPKYKRWAETWLKGCDGSVPRAAVKRSVMTLPYGSTRYSCQRYLLDWYSEAMPDQPFGVDNFKASWYLTGLVWSAIERVVVSARDGMAWLQSVARMANKAKVPLIWTAPSGFPVRQEYKHAREVTVETAIGDRVRHTRVRHERKKLAGRRQINGISPNFIHSLDAAALVKTVNACALTGIESYAMIHDSFGCLGGDAAMMARHLRRAYSQMFSEDILAEFRDQIQTQLDKPLPPLPVYGSLDPRVVEESTYFFA